MEAVAAQLVPGRYEDSNQIFQFCLNRADTLVRDLESVTMAPIRPMTFSPSQREMGQKEYNAWLSSLGSVEESRQDT